MKKIAEKIKQHLISLAKNDKLPIDLNDLQTEEIVNILSERVEISTDTIMSGIVCNKCKEEIPPHSVEQHLDPMFMEYFHKCSTTDSEKFWNGKAKSMIGKKIIQARYMTKQEAEEMGWYKRPLIFIFDDGSYMFPSKDDEGNDGGAILGQRDIYGDEGGFMDFPTL